MITFIINEFKLIRDAIRKGNEYRLEKYGPPETFYENWKRGRDNYKKYCENNLPKCRPFFESSADLIHQENFKMKFQYWDEWTGGRYARRENPYISMTDTELNRLGIKRPNVENGSICRSNPVTGYWEAL